MDISSRVQGPWIPRDFEEVTPPLGSTSLGQVISFIAEPFWFQKSILTFIPSDIGMTNSCIQSANCSAPEKFTSPPLLPYTSPWLWDEGLPGKACSPVKSGKSTLTQGCM